MGSIAWKAARRAWLVVRRVAPGLARRADARRSQRLRASAAMAGAVQMEERVQTLERELHLVTRQLAAVTMRMEQALGSRPAGAAEPNDEETRLINARLSAISFYEERIARLESAAGIARPPAEPARPR